jgi:myosin heavy subunit
MCQKLISTLWDDSMPGFDDMAGKTLASVKSSRHRSRVLDLNIWKGKVKVPEESLQLGKTKVFLRKQAHDLLEARRSRRVSSAACKMQSIYRGWLSRRWFLMVAWAVRVIQRLGRGLIARGMARNLRHQRAAKLLQTATRRHICRRKYTKFVIAVVKLQNLFRSKGARAQLNTMKFLRNITRLQRLVRGLTNRKKYLRLRKYFVALQCLVRRFVARRKLRGLRIAARDVGSLRQSNEALKAEIEMLRAKAAEEAKRLSELAYAAEQQQRDHALDDLAALKAEFEKEKERRIAAEAKAEEALKIIAAKEIEIQNANEKIRSDEILLKSMEASLVSSQSSLSQALVNVAKYEAEIHSLRRRSGNVMPSSNEDNDMTIVLSEALAEAQQETRDLTEKMKILEYELALSKANFITTGADKKVSNENTMEALTRERCLREQMEDEITVLRGQIDNLKLQQRSNGQAVLTVPSRRPDAEPRRRSQVQNSAILSVRSSDSSENGAMKKKKVVGSSQQKGMSEKAPFEGEEDNTIMNSDGDPMTKSVNANVSPFSDRSQRVANKSIKPSMKSGPMPSVNPLLTSSPASVSQHTALQTFERNVSSFRDKLRHVSVSFDVIEVISSPLITRV